MDHLQRFQQSLQQGEEQVETLMLLIQLEMLVVPEVVERVLLFHKEQVALETHHP